MNYCLLTQNGAVHKFLFSSETINLMRKKHCTNTRVSFHGGKWSGSNFKVGGEKIVICKEKRGMITKFTNRPTLSKYRKGVVLVLLSNQRIINFILRDFEKLKFIYFCLNGL